VLGALRRRCPEPAERSQYRLVSVEGRKPTDVVLADERLTAPQHHPEGTANV
jgi:hypothetical protein